MKMLIGAGGWSLQIKKCKNVLLFSNVHQIKQTPWNLYARRIALFMEKTFLDLMIFLLVSINHCPISSFPTSICLSSSFYNPSNPFPISKSIWFPSNCLFPREHLSANSQTPMNTCDLEKPLSLGPRAFGLAWIANGCQLDELEMRLAWLNEWMRQSQMFNLHGIFISRVRTLERGCLHFTLSHTHIGQLAMPNTHTQPHYSRPIHSFFLQLFRISRWLSF